MAEGITLKRIIDMDEATELTSSDYALVDSATGGPKKFALGDELSSLKEDFVQIDNALLNGSPIQMLDKLSLTEGTLWTGNVGSAIATDTWANAIVRNDALVSFGDCNAFIALNGIRIAIKEVDSNNIIVSQTSMLTESTTYTFKAQYRYAFNFSKADYANITTQDVVSGVSISADTKINELSEAITNLEDVFQRGVNPLTLEWVDGYFLSGDSSTYNANASFHYTKPFYIGKKCTINIKCRGYNTVVNILSKTNEKDGGYYKEILRSTDSNYKWYSGEITEPGYYTICCSKLFDAYAYIQDEKESQNNNVLSMFNKIICCGDSLTYGLVYNSAIDTRQARVPINEALTKITGVSSERYATAGYSAKDWWDNNSTHLNIDGIYIIFLGTNGGLTDTVSTDCPGTDISGYADTNTGCYGKILRTLQINNKTAVLVKPPSANATTQGVVQRLADKFGFATVSLPDLSSNYYHYAPHNTGYKNDVHYNDLGYVHIANCINYAINNMSEVNLFRIAPYQTS